MQDEEMLLIFSAGSCYITGETALIGAVSEWLKEAVLKTVEPQGSGGSNPPCSVLKTLCVFYLEVLPCKTSYNK